MESVIWNHVPSYWDKRYNSISDPIPINKGFAEYRSIYSDVCRATNINEFSSICRYQNLYDYGQMLIREQLLIKLYDSTTHYRARRFTKVKKYFLDIALQYNLDHRRCGQPNLEFKKQLYGIRSDDVILAVIVVTDKPGADVIIPKSTSEYFIDYVIKQ